MLLQIRKAVRCKHNEVSDECRMVEEIRTVKMMFTTGTALLLTQMPGIKVGCVSVGSAALLVGIASLTASLLNSRSD